MKKTLFFKSLITLLPAVYMLWPVASQGSETLNAMDGAKGEPPSFPFSAELILYILGLVLPGIAARGYCRLKEKSLVNKKGEQARENYYHLGLGLNWIFLAYVFWFFAGLSIVGGMDSFWSVCINLWKEVLRWGLPPTKIAYSAYYLCLSTLVGVFYLAGAVWVKMASYRISRLLRSTTWSWGQTAWLALRHQLIFLIPPIVWMVLFPFVPQNRYAYWFFLFFYVFLFFALSPLFVRFIWKSRPLDHAEMLERIPRLCAKAGIRVKGVRILETSSGKIANAMVSGLFPFYRYIFFTDYLLTHFTPEEAETVLAHEIGHIKKRHLWLNLGLLLLWMVASHFIYRGAAPVFKLLDLPIVFFYLFWFFLFYGVILKFFSRGFERQADEYCMELTGQLETYISALNKLTEINFSTRKWVGFDRLLKTHPDLEGRIQNLRERKK
jgi:Zn-dependent protease with chaperone function